jgi:hypothetical protein
MGNEIRVIVLSRWDVFSCIAVRHDTLKGSNVELSWKPPGGQARLFIQGRLALPPSSLAVTQSPREQGESATLRPNHRPELVVGGA